MKDDILAFIGGLALGISLGIRLCEIADKRKKKKKGHRMTMEEWREYVEEDASTM